MIKYSTTLTAMIFLSGFLGHTISQQDVPNAEEVLNKVSSAINLTSSSGIPNINNINTSGIHVLEEATNAFKQRCEQYGGDGAFENVENARDKFKQCLDSFVNYTALEQEMEQYKPTGDLDIVFKKYCQKTPTLKQCVRNFTTAVEHCVQPQERKNKELVHNITDSLLNFVCYKEGDRIALFISANGPECLKSKQQEIQQCINSTLGSYMIQLDSNTETLHLLDNLPLLALGNKECTDMSKLQSCIVKDLEECSDPTPANIVDSIFNFIRRATPCQNMMALESAASNFKVNLLVTISLVFVSLRFVVFNEYVILLKVKVTFQCIKKINFFIFKNFFHYIDCNVINKICTILMILVPQNRLTYLTMPGKGGRRRKSGHAGKKAELTSDEDSINNDACSISSSQSDNRSMLDDMNDNEVDEFVQQEAFEEKLKEAIDGLTQKSAKGRTICFKGMEKIFAIKYIPDFVEDRKMTITDSVERGLKKGRGEEQSTAARLSTLLCVQLGAFESAEVVCRDLKSTLTLIVSDTTASTQARSECCWALSMNQFLSGNDATATMEIVQLLSTIFSGSYLKGNGAIATISVEVAALHSAAISAWTLLLTVMPPADIYNLLASNRTNSYMPSLNRLCELLESPHLDVRLSAGEALAVIFELGRDFSCDYEQDWSLDLIEVLKELATDSNKYRAKKDRKQQRANFRDILRYIDEDIVPEMHVKFGQEILYLEGWCARTQYNACCRLLGPGINIHLAENQLLREIFHLGNKVLPIPLNQKTSKLERTLMNAAAFKARTIQRNKNRDKRSAALAP
ncbi:interferon-related developmental regulator 1-like [Bombus vosnesenskii]|uniref:Interferon-related developmental regulator 1-like n=3 Tax=Pyrobombus TaxID=144703 RepID=A0A6J3KQ33_9HYME|nr:interferon-related developmental regulator 1-like [Bombus bifarius]XP_033355408.1 interferon-related developmental regulator 1-like [Bombus vosnesenskii]